MLRTHSLSKVFFGPGPVDPHTGSTMSQYVSGGQSSGSSVVGSVQASKHVLLCFISSGVGALVVASSSGGISSLVLY